MQILPMEEHPPDLAGMTLDLDLMAIGQLHAEGDGEDPNSPLMQKH